MAKLSLPSFVGAPGATQLNTWKAALEAQAEDTVSLTGVLPNSMTVDLDMDSNDILNVGSLNVNLLNAADVNIGGLTVSGVLTEASASATAAAASEAAAQDAANSIVGFYDTLAELKTGTDIVIGDVVKTYGYTTPGDGGGSLYEIVAAATGTDDGGSFINLAGSGLQAKGLFGGTANVKQFGAKGDGVADDAGATQAAINYSVIHESTTFFPEGEYLIDSEVSSLAKNIKLAGDKGSRLLFSDSGDFNFTPALVAETTLSAGSLRKDRTINVTSSAGISVGDPITLLSTETAETSTNYKKTGLYFVQAISSNTITVDRPLRFNFIAGTEVKVLQQDTSIFINNLEVHKVLASAKLRVILLTYFSYIEINNVKVTCPTNVNSYGVAISRCCNVHINNTETVNGTYPYLIGLCTGVFVEGLSAKNVHHAVDFNTFSENCYVNNFNIDSRNGGINSHPSFNVHYSNGTTSDRLSNSNLRSAGGSLTNVNIHSSAPTQTLYFHWSLMTEADWWDDAEDLGLTFAAKNVYINNVNQQNWFPNYGVVTLDNIKGVNTTIGPGDEVTELYVNGIKSAWYNRRTYNVKGGSNIVQPILDGGVYTIDAYTPEVEIASIISLAKVRGDVFFNNTTDPCVATIRIYTNPVNDSLAFWISNVLTLKAYVFHSNAGAFDEKHKTFEIMHRKPPTSEVYLTNALFESSTTGNANASLDLTIGNLSQVGVSESAVAREHYVQFDVTLTSGRTLPKYSLTYELEMTRIP